MSYLSFRIGLFFQLFYRASHILLLLSISACLSGLFAETVHPQASSIAQRVFILVNQSSEDSQLIAEYYCRKRAIPQANIIRLPLSTDEVISLDAYVETIHNPLLDVFLERGLVEGVVHSEMDAWGRKKMSVATHHIAYLVTTKGVPLKFTVSHSGQSPEAIKAYTNTLDKEEASVDSELSAMLFNYYSLFAGAIENPEYAMTPAALVKPSRVIRVARLDAPSRKQVLKMIDDSVAVESYGLRGRAYVDLGGPFAEGNEWIARAGSLLEGAHYEVDYEKTKRSFNYTDRLDAPAIYVGWYKHRANHQWLDRSVRVPRGAIAYHLHSFSANTLRSERKNWLGPLLAKGYALTFGYVYEPFLGLSVRPDLFFQSLLTGRSAGEAFSLANPALSWQSILIGDPLYRPFAFSLEEQMKSEATGAFASYRQLNQFYKNKSLFGEAEALQLELKASFDEPNIALMLTLATALLKGGQSDRVIQLLKPLTYLKGFDLEDVSLADAAAQLLREAGDSRSAMLLYQKLLFAGTLPKDLELKLLERALTLAYANRAIDFSSRINKRLIELKGID